MDKIAKAILLGLLTTAIVIPGGDQGFGQGGTWPTKTPMPTPRGGLAARVVNGILYAVGGSDSRLSTLSTVEAYDPATNTWTTKAPMPTPRGGLAAEVVNGILYAVGGGAGGGIILSTVEAYAPATNTWTGKAPMPTPRGSLAAGVVNRELVIAVSVPRHWYSGRISMLEI